MFELAIAVTLSASVSCNNQNFFTSDVCNAPVAEFHQVENGFEGVLESGIGFTQLNVLEGQNERIMRMSIQNAYWYICRGNSIWADNDLQALSICLAT